MQKNLIKYTYCRWDAFV